MQDANDPGKQITINFYDDSILNDRWNITAAYKGDKAEEAKVIFSKITSSLDLIKKICSDGVNSCPGILDMIKENIFKDTSKKSENESKLNELNEKIQLIENRIKLLDEIILKLPRELEKTI